MLLDRLHRLSIKESLKSLFENPPAESGLSAFNVYSEADMRDMNKGKFSPEAPHLFITDAPISPTLAQLPFIGIIAASKKESFELGNPQGRRVSADLHIFGRSRGERDDLSSFIADYLKSVTVKNHNDYTFMGFESGATMCGGTIDEEPEMTPMTVGEEESKEGSLTNWLALSFEYRSKF